MSATPLCDATYVWGGPMDFALVNAFVRSEAPPAPDPWFADESIACYALGSLGPGRSGR
ncbi:MAG: hypothetical protein E6I52_26420 [Chloroflexi bacterium]|nr:MAG: hypothetical protein E6I52_26420 [Chloroflexota bacterium]